MGGVCFQVLLQSQFVVTSRLERFALLICSHAIRRWSRDDVFFFYLGFTPCLYFSFFFFFFKCDSFFNYNQGSVTCLPASLPGAAVPASKSTALCVCESYIAFFFDKALAQMQQILFPAANRKQQTRTNSEASVRIEPAFISSEIIPSQPSHDGGNWIQYYFVGAVLSGSWF